MLNKRFVIRKACKTKRMVVGATVTPDIRPKHVSDTSIVGWQVMAMKSAIGSGLEVKPQNRQADQKISDSNEATTDIGMFGYYDQSRPKQNGYLASLHGDRTIEPHVSWSRKRFHRDPQRSESAWMSGGRITKALTTESPTCTTTTTRLK